MALTDDQIDKLYKDAVSKQKQPKFEEQYWQEMEAILDQQKQKKRRASIWSVGVVCIVATTIISSCYFYVRSKIINKQIHTAQKTEHLIERKTQTLKDIKKDNVAVIPSVNTNPANKVTLTKEKTTNSLSNKLTIVASQNVQYTETIPKTFGQDYFSATEVSINNSTKNALLTVNKLDKQKISSLPITPLHIRANNQVNDPLFGGRFSPYSGISFAANNSYMANSKILNLQWGLKIGTNYAYNDRLRLGFGIGFRREKIHSGADGSDLKIQNVQIHYALDQIRHEQIIAYDRMQFIDLNIHAHYLMGNVSVGVQLTPSYTLGARGYVIERGKTLSGGGKSMQDFNREEKFPYVRTNNLKTLGLNVGISLQYEFKNKTIFEVGVHSRLNKMLNSNQFSGVHRSLPLRIEVGFIKHFVK